MAGMPLLFSLQQTGILTVVQKHSVAPMFACLAYSRLQLQFHACIKGGSEGTEPWRGCMLLKTQVVINVLFSTICPHLQLTSDAP